MAGHSRLEPAAPTRPAYDLGCVNTFVSVSRARKMGHERAVLTPLSKLRDYLGHVADQEFQAHRVFTGLDPQPSMASDSYRASNNALGVPPPTVAVIAT